MTGIVRSFGRDGRSFKEGRERFCIDASLGRLDWVKIGISDSDAPGDQTVRTDFNAFFCHNQCAIHKAEIAYRAGSIFPERERTAGIQET
jgi:hypothetical protein